MANRKLPAFEEIFSETLELYKKNLPFFLFSAILPIGLWKIWRILFIPLLIIILGIKTSSYGNLYSAIGSGIMYALILLLISIFIAYELVLFETVTLILILRDSPKKFHQLKNVILEAGKKLWQLTLTSFLVYLFVVLGIFTLILPGLILSFLFQFFPYAVILDGKVGFSAIKKSYTLISRNFIPVFIRSFPIWITAILIHLLLRKLLLPSIISLSIVTPFFLAYHYLLYKHLTGKR